jgi:hypothetical protein
MNPAWFVVAWPTKSKADTLFNRNLIDRYRAAAYD